MILEPAARDDWLAERLDAAIVVAAIDEGEDRTQLGPAETEPIAGLLPLELPDPRRAAVPRPVPRPRPLAL